MTFDALSLSEPLLRALAKIGHHQPTPVQAAAIPAALAGRDLLVSAATGSGKTAAFLLPSLQRLLDSEAPPQGVRALVLTPTRELARQIHDTFLQLASYTRLTAEAITGGESRAHQISALRRNPDLLIATPGRLREFLDSGQADLRALQILILDEADRMLDMGFAEEVLDIIGRTNPERQTLLFSATLEHRSLARLIGPCLRDPERIALDAVRVQHPNIRHQVLLSDDPEHKRRQLSWLLEQESFEKALIFTNTRDSANQLGEALRAAGQRVAVLHGELDQRERKRVMGLFQRGEVRALIATDLAARGLDIAGVERVFNLEVARTGEDYLHRSGRTGRAGQEGVSILLVGPSEWNRLESIGRYLGLNFEWRAIEGLKARFKGPAKKKRKPVKDEKAVKKEAEPKRKDRLRDRKNIGKRRKPASDATSVEAGQSPLKRRRDR
ncbi:MAG: DEAD/DEAH box helicase [Chromatiaceae bacterium]|nr:DEAD/DEAH box helicase [Chromatiaceae bacterium]